MYPSPARGHHYSSDILVEIFYINNGFFEVLAMFLYVPFRCTWGIRLTMQVVAQPKSLTAAQNRATVREQAFYWKMPAKWLTHEKGWR